MLLTIFSSKNLSLRRKSSKFVLLYICYLLYTANWTSIWQLISFRITFSQVVFGLPAGCHCFVFPLASLFEDFVCFCLRLKRCPDYDSFHCFTVLDAQNLTYLPLMFIRTPYKLPDFNLL